MLSFPIKIIYIFFYRLRNFFMKNIFLKLHNRYKNLCDNLKYGSFGHKSKIVCPMRIIGKSRIFIGNNVKILNYARLETVRVWSSLECNGKLIIGDRTSIEQCCHIIAADEVKIGRDCVFSAFVYISDCSHQYNPSESIMASKLVRKKVIIGDHVFIGIGSCIMLGVTIGNNAVIGANSVVTKDVPAECMVAGVPAEIIKCWNGTEWKSYSQNSTRKEV